MTLVRRLTDEGLRKFTEYLSDARSDPTLGPPRHLLEDSAASRPMATDIPVEEVDFRSKRQAGEYLNELLAPVEYSTVRRDSGLWSWLSLFFFDQLCPADEEDHRKVSKTEQYILVADYRRYYRHLLVTPWEIYREYPDGAWALLSGTVDTHGDFVEQLASRQEIVTNRSLIQVSDELYYDRSAGCPKRGARSRDRPGNVRRLVEIKQQLDLTYDLYGLDAEAVLDILPEEFDFWLSG